MNEEKLRNKIKRLMDLAARPGTEAEGAAAKEALDKLLEIHNIPLETLEEGKVKIQFLDCKVHDWVSNLLIAAAKLNECSYFVHVVYEDKKELRYYALVGYPEYIEQASKQHKELIETVRKESIAKYPGQRMEQLSFRLGASVGLALRAQDILNLRSMLDKINSKENTLVPVDKCQLEREARMEKEQVKEKAKKPKKVNQFAYEHGKAFASRVDLNRKLGGTESKQINAQSYAMGQLGKPPVSGRNTIRRKIGGSNEESS